MGKTEQIVSLSHLVVIAYALVYWLKNEKVISTYTKWKTKSDLAESVELQDLLTRILKENVQVVLPEKPKDGSVSSVSSEDTSNNKQPQNPQSEPTSEPTSDHILPRLNIQQFH